ncbi:MAG: SDR family NAD(P)-dependent oxidoreductase [Panacagrimonas sp.]
MNAQTPMFREGVALIVGGTGGFGQAVCAAFARAGAALAFTYRSRAEAAQQVAAALAADGLASLHWQLDLADFAQIEARLAEIQAAMGPIHSVVYAAGPKIGVGPVAKLDPVTVARVMNEDVMGFFHLARAALPMFKAQGYGSLTAITTTQASHVEIRGSLSAAPKAAVESLIRTIAKEEARNGIRANSVRAGWADTGHGAELLSNKLSDKARQAIMSSIPMSRFGLPDEIAQAVLFLASDRASFITGVAVAADGGQHL